MRNRNNAVVETLNLSLIFTFLAILSMVLLMLPPTAEVPAQKSDFDTKPANIVPPSPPGCVAGTTNFANTDPPVVITDVAPVASTITVAGMGTYLWDLDLNTDIRHTRNSHLDITLTSPAGTVVTITSGNGGGADDIFDGTRWDDDGGTPVTDFTHVSGTTSTPLVPEEALAAFVGEDPNGTWTLDIVDGVAFEDGSLDGWDLDVTTFGFSAPSETTANLVNTNNPAVITDGAVVLSALGAAGLPAGITKVTLETSITHSWSSDLDVTLFSPAGTVVTITTDNGGINDDVFDGTLWDDDADDPVTDHTFVNLTTSTPLVPEGAMGAFLGEDPNGTWLLNIIDDAAGGDGSLDGWKLNISTGSCVTSAGASVFGKVVTQSGRGIYRATVSMTNSEGTRISRQTSVFGYFRFEDIAVGQTYTVTVDSKNHKFNPVLLNVKDSISDLVLTAEN